MLWCGKASAAAKSRAPLEQSRVPAVPAVTWIAAKVPRNCKCSGGFGFVVNGHDFSVEVVIFLAVFLFQRSHYQSLIHAASPPVRCWGSGGVDKSVGPPLPLKKSMPLVEVIGNYPDNL